MIPTLLLIAARKGTHMPARSARPKLATKEAAAVSFPTWSQLARQAQVDKGPYQIPFDLPGGKQRVVEIPVLDGDQYYRLVAAQARGNVVGVFDALFRDDKDKAFVLSQMRGVDFPIMDTLATQIVRYFYGLSIEVEADDEDEDPGNSSAS